MIVRCTQIAQDTGMSPMPGSPPVEGTVRVTFQYEVPGVPDLKHTFDLRMLAADAASSYAVGVDYDLDLTAAP